jgi:hypothetical protein
MRRFLRGGTMAVALLAVAQGASSAPSADRLIAFDGIAAGTLLTTQYAPAGVQFGTGPTGVSACGPVGIFAMPAYASSPPNAAFASGSGEFPSARFCLRLTSLASRVSLQAGTNVLGSFSQNVSLIGYGASGAALSGNGVATRTVPANGLAGPSHHLAIATRTARIRWAVVQLGPPGGGIAGGQVPGIDDLSFDSSASVPPSFTLTTAGTTRLVRAGSTASLTLTVLRFGDTPSNGSITFSTTGLPKGITASFSPSVVSGSTPAQQVKLTLQAAATAPPTSTINRVPFKITATPGSTAAGPGPANVTASVGVVPALIIKVADAAADSASAGPPAHVEVFSCEVDKVPITLRVPKSDSPPPGPVTPAVMKPAGMDWITPTLAKTTIVPGVDPMPAAVDTLALKLAAFKTTDGWLHPSLDVRATEGPGIVRDIDLRVGRRNAKITELHSGAGVATPALLRPGSLAEIWGYGFCPGSTVQFGNKLAIAKASSVLQGSPQIVKARTPPLATSGMLTVFNPVGGWSTSAPIYAITPRNTYGYSFKNYSRDSMGWDVAVALFGEDQTMLDVGDPCGMATLGAVDCGPGVIPDPVVWGWWQVMKSKADGGICFGWVLSAQRITRNEASLYDFPPGNAGYQWELAGPKGPSSPLDFYIQQQHVAQFSIEKLNYDWSGESTFESLAALRARYRDQLVKARALNRGLPLISLKFNGSGHIVAVWDALDLSNGNLILFVIDPNVPFKASEDKNAFVHLKRESLSRITFQTNGDWVFSNDFDGVLWNGSLDAVHYLDARKIPVQPTPPLGISSGFVVFSSGADVSQVVDEAGHRLFRPDGEQETDPRLGLPGAAVVPTFDGLGRSSPATVAVRGLKRVNAEVRPRGRGAWSTAFTGGEASAAVQVGRGERAALTFDPRAEALAVRPQSAVPIRLQLAVRAADGSRRSVSFEGLSTGGSDRLAFDRKSQTVRLSHQGAPTSGSIALEWVGRSGSRQLPSALTSPRLVLNSGQEDIIRPANWRRISAGITISLHKSGGKVVERHAHDVGARSAGVTMTSLRVLGNTSLRRRLAIRNRYKALPDGTTATAVWIVRRGRRVVGTHVERLHGAAVRPGARTRTWRFKAPGEGRYRFDAAVLLLRPDGRSSILRRTLRFRVV